MAGKWCSVCKSNFRGLYVVHASTEKHRRNARRASGGGRAHRGDLKRALGYATVNVRRAVRGYGGEDHERVRTHRRRRPLDGPRRSVKVHRYWRQRVFRWRPTKWD